MLKWFRHYRRRRIQSRPLPAAWLDVLSKNVPFRSRLPTSFRRKLDQSIGVIVAEKNWEGCGGLSLTDEHRVTIAAHASRLTLGFEDDYFDDVLSILVYPSAYTAPVAKYLGAGLSVEEHHSRSGEAWHRGPVIIAWDAVDRQTHDASNDRNVVLHEFAHKLDMRNGGGADGVPVIESATDAAEWIDVTTRDFERLCEACRHGFPLLLDCYGATNPAEYFAVATEAFFESPLELAMALPDTFDLLRWFYRQQALETPPLTCT